MESRASTAVRGLGCLRAMEPLRVEVPAADEIVPMQNAPARRSVSMAPHVPAWVGFAGVFGMRNNYQVHELPRRDHAAYWLRSRLLSGGFGADHPREGSD
jgi:hypothetical protein